MGFWRSKLTDSPVNISIGEVFKHACEWLCTRVAADCVHMLIFSIALLQCSCVCEENTQEKKKKKLKALLLVQDFKPEKKQPSSARQQINVPKSCKQRQKSMHTCQLYTYTNNTSVKVKQDIKSTQ